MVQRIAAHAGYLVITWFLLMAIIAVIAVTFEGEVSGGALGGIVTVAMLVSAYVALTVRPFASLPRSERIRHRLLFTAALFGAWLAIGITAWDWDGGNIAAGVGFCVIALLRAAFPPPAPDVT
jgi:hypothetical protein